MGWTQGYARISSLLTLEIAERSQGIASVDMEIGGSRMKYISPHVILAEISQGSYIRDIISPHACDSSGHDIYQISPHHVISLPYCDFNQYIQYLFMISQL